MNFESIKIGFAAWLEGQNTDNNTQTNENITSDVSIFANADAFKEYLTEELNINFDISSMKISDILNMDIVNGKLIDPSEESDSNPDELNVGEQEMLITNILNELMQDETIQGIIDIDGNSEISNDEVNNFMNAIKGLDSNDEDISLADIFSAITGIKNNTFSITDESSTPEEIEETIVSTPAASPSASSSNGNFASSGGSFTPSSNATTANNKANTAQKKSLDGMNLDELNNELDTTQSNLSEQKTALSNALSGSTPELEALQGQVDEAYDAYKEQLELIDEDLAEEMEAIETAVDDAQADLEAKEQAVYEQEGVVADCTTTYNNAVSKRENLESIVSQLKSTDTSDMSDEQKSSLAQKLASAETQLETAKTEEGNAKTALENAESELKTREGAVDSAKDVLESAEKDKADFEKTLLEEHSEIKTYLDAYNNAKETFNTEKSTAVTNARAEVQVSENYINEIKTAITKAENKEREKEYRISGNGEYDEEEGQRLVDTARQMLAKYGSSTGWCAKGVSQTFAMAYGLDLHGNGCDWDTNMEGLVEQGMFAEVTDDYPSSTDLASLPAGAVVCWEATTGVGSGGSKYGHVTIADGNGGEISDHYAANIYTTIGGGTDQYRVFIPVS